MKHLFLNKELSQLAKEKGFDEPSVLVLYNPPKKERGGYEIKGKYTKRTYKDYYKNPCRDNIERIHLVTQSLLQRWLREVHNIHIEVKLATTLPNFKCRIWIKPEEGKNCSNIITEIYNSYEEALEAGLKEALKLI